MNKALDSYNDAKDLDEIEAAMGFVFEIARHQFHGHHTLAQIGGTMAQHFGAQRSEIG